MAGKSKYDPEIHPQLIKYMARSGLTVKEMCRELGGIAHTTLIRWTQKYWKVAEALKTGRNFVDSLVEDSLLKNALGFEYTTQVATKKGEVVTLTVFKPGDTGAQALWLKSRKRPSKTLDARLAWLDNFRVEHEVINPDALPISELTNDELDSKIRRLERAIGSVPGEAPAPSSGPKPDTLH